MDGSRSVQIPCGDLQPGTTFKKIPKGKLNKFHSALGGAVLLFVNYLHFFRNTFTISNDFQFVYI